MFCNTRFERFFTIFGVAFTLFFTIQCAHSESVVKPINAENNARMHNGRGVMYMKEKDYLAAIKEFKIAIALNPRKQSTASYFNNLGCAYLEIGKLWETAGNTKKAGGFGQWAENSFESAIVQDPANLTYYRNLVESFRLQGTLKSSLAKFKKSKNTFDPIIVGLIYEKMGDKSTARTIFDNFATEHPDLILSKSLKMRY